MTMHNAKTVLTSILLLALYAITAGFSLAQEPLSGGNESCLECHEVASGELTNDYDSSLTISAHQGFECTDCHMDIEELPHPEELADVDCGVCHDDAAETYQWHGRLHVDNGEDIPSCASCHGKHDILPSSDKASRVNPLNLPETCGKCHEDIDLTKKHEILYGQAVKVYQSSVHGKATLGGIYFAATCNDCHSTGGTAHRILAPNDPESPINHFNIPKTCGKCHRNIENDYWEGIHGKLVARGEVDAPVCTHCHGEHGIISPSDPRSPVSPTRLAEATCAPCHESAYLNEKYGVPTGRLQTYIDSYHGLKSKAGDLTVANCASCHGAHRILPHTDPTSSIYPGNLKETCGNCHPGISAEMASTRIHGTPGITQTAAAGVVRIIYIIAIVIIIGAMVIHWLVDLRKQIHNVNRKKQIIRMNWNEVWQHTFLMVSFVVLVITGFALRFSDAFWVQWLFGWEGGFPLRGIIHRVAAAVLIATALWHVMYLTTSRGHRFLVDIFPAKRDFRQFMHMIGYNLGLRKDRPRFGRFSYVEKAEYWALVWGTVMMVVTGILLWFDNFAVQYFPKGFLDVMLVIHYYEAWLAFLAIIIWHLYSTIFSPLVYPMNPSWYTGKMPAEVYELEHPEDPVITGKIQESESHDKSKEINSGKP
jgi:cytochrome b subunit of formate dehydrogenase